MQSETHGINPESVQLQVRDSVQKVRARLQRLKKIVLYEERELRRSIAHADPAAETTALPGLGDLVRTLQDLSTLLDSSEKTT